MNRYYYVTKDMEDLVRVEKELEQQGVLPEQMHVLPHSDAVADQFGVESIDSFSRKDILGSLGMGFSIGCAVVLLLLIAAYFVGVSNYESWLMLTIISMLIIGFCTWEGGLMGIQTPNHQFRRFARDLKRGFSVFFVDVAKGQEALLNSVTQQHMQLQPVGHGTGESAWTLKLRHNWHRYYRAA